MITTISNPPYNLKWEHPLFAQTQDRFSHTVVPPQSNANYAFILTALEESDRCVFILPTGVLSSRVKQEQVIRQYLIDSNYLDAVILCPDNMFEDTSIATCILVLDKNKTTTTVEMIDARKRYVEEIRYQNGQFGSKSHKNRTYEKKVKVFTDEIIEEILLCINERKNIKDFCKAVTIEEIKNKDYRLIVSMYFEVTVDDFETENHRSYEDILIDLNRVINEKNKCKLTINETLAKNLGFDIELYKKDQTQDEEFDNLLYSICGSKIKKHDYFRTTKNKNEVKFENNSKENVSSIFMMIFNMWKQHLYYLNNEENRYLCELRDALLPDLMSGKITLRSDEE